MYTNKGFLLDVFGDHLLTISKILFPLKSLIIIQYHSPSISPSHPLSSTRITLSLPFHPHRSRKLRKHLHLPLPSLLPPLSLLAISIDDLLFSLFFSPSLLISLQFFFKFSKVQARKIHHFYSFLL